MNQKAPAILQVLPELGSGGVERGTIEIANAQKLAGFTPIVASAGGALVPWLERTGAIHIEMPAASKNPIQMWQNSDRLVKIIKEYNVEIVHARSRAPAWSAWAACHQTPAKFLTTFHGTYNIQNKLKHLYNSVMVRGERVIAISNFIIKHIEENYNVEPHLIRHIPRGVDLNLFNPERVSGTRVAELAKEWHVPDGLPVLLMPGRVTRWKGHEPVIRALGRLSHRNFFCVFAGDVDKHPDYVEELQTLVKELELEGHVRFTGPTQQMTEAYQLADIVLCPSIEPEAFGRVPIEAQAMGKPVITTNHGGTAETVIDGKTGFLTTPGDIVGITDALYRLLTLSQEERMSFGRIGAEHVRKHFSLQQMCEKTLMVYDELLREKK